MRRRDFLASGLATAGLDLLGLAALPRGAQAAPVVLRLDPRLDAVIDPGARLEVLHRGARWCEGLCWAPALGGLVFSDVRANRIGILDAERRVHTLRDPSNNANGNTLDARGRLVTCEHRGRRVVRREADGRLTVLADSFGGKPLNAPNDVALASDGALWFTDPVFGIRQADEGLVAEPAQAARRVYRIDPAGTLRAMTDAVGQPNGLAFAPDGRVLYVSDASAALNPEAARTILAFAVGPDQSLGAKRTFAALESGAPDGLAVDAAGNLYAACEDGVRIYAPDAAPLGRIATPKAAANLTFGADGRRLFIAAGDAIHAIDLKRRAGAPRG
ncbi:SMP-30/gluconolactonase/LRE family protein [Methylobacterium planeticum]|uniref:SMP-30/gluconolactonase/LRE family protein n=1 Tax=Methylobacterium planeticum TaxID=2615211 RepID=A0A6N6MKK8_9HYPH|nr:SMP-30/gluconolactonase/LRE family protein [Methylobacterium planeticum]KAB1070215.1 SMP-30/gluconolactonase/LRE family protein [Methylobacterium planeticum]